LLLFFFCFGFYNKLYNNIQAFVSNRNLHPLLATYGQFILTTNLVGIDSPSYAQRMSMLSAELFINEKGLIV
jgi:F0F1-type ATP synthase membrane subunit a